MLSLFLRKSAWIPKQRSHEFAQALDARIRELGGDIEYNTRAEEIRVRDGRVTGVVTSRGERINAKHVISNASPTLTYNHLIHPKEEVPEIALRACNARVPGVSSFVVYMGLDATLEELGLDGYTIFVLKNMNTEAIYDSMGTLGAPGLQAALCLNNALPDCSPPGTAIVSLTSLLRPEPWKDVRPQDYVAVKNRIASDLITDFENATCTSLRPHIEEFEVATPQTFARYTGAYKGIIYGYEPEPWDSLIPRLMMMLEEDHYIDGLRFCGGNAFRCHGYNNSTRSGQTAALLALRDMNVGG
jgi:prolycopene isomerase